MGAGCGYACGGPSSFMGRVGWAYVRDSAGAALLAAFLSELRVLASLFGRLVGVRGVRAHEEEADWAPVLVLVHDFESCCKDSRTEREAQRAFSFPRLLGSGPKRSTGNLFTFI